jgi:hypothetical protein
MTNPEDIPPELFLRAGREIYRTEKSIKRNHAIHCDVQKFRGIFGTVPYICSILWRIKNRGGSEERGGDIDNSIASSTNATSGWSSLKWNQLIALAERTLSQSSSSLLADHHSNDSSSSSSNNSTASTNEDIETAQDDDHGGSRITSADANADTDIDTEEDELTIQATRLSLLSLIIQRNQVGTEFEASFS